MLKAYLSFKPVMLSCLAGVLLASLPVSSQAQAISTFDADNEGWTVVDRAQPAPDHVIGTVGPTGWQSAGGNPGGFVFSGDPSNDWFFFSAPGKFLGNQISTYGGTLSFDLFDGSQEPTHPSFIAVVLTGAGKTLYANGSYPATTFIHYEYSLAPGQWFSDPGNGFAIGSPASASDIQSVLGALDGLYISGDWFDGNEVSGIDNVQLGSSSAPEPGALVLILFGMTGVMARGRKLPGRQTL